MKKLLALVLVLALASFANANFVISGPASLATGAQGTYNVSITDTNYNLLGAMISADKGSIGSPAIIAFTGQDAAANQIYGSNVVGVGAGLNVAIPAGVPLFSFVFTAPAALGPAILRVVDDTENGMTGGSFKFDSGTSGNISPSAIGAGTFECTITPEPMTLSLLALGGLAALRRRHA